GQATFQVSVASAPLTAGALTPPAAVEGQPISGAVLFHFIDADPNAGPEDYTATVSWGDGTVESSAVSANVAVVASASGGFDVVGSHTYAEALSGKTFSVSVSDPDGAGTSASTNTLSVIDAVLTAGALTPPVAKEGQPIGGAVLFH